MSGGSVHISNTLATATRTLATVTSTTEYKPKNQVRSLPLNTNANMIPRKSKDGSLDSTHASGGSVTSTPFASFACVSRLLQAMGIAPMRCFAFHMVFECLPCDLHHPKNTSHLSTPLRCLYTNATFVDSH